jgi:hypothetical protein
MFHFKAPGRFLPERSPARDWGRFEHFVEVADDQYASRQLNLFKSGQILRYDQSHRRDAFGQLLGAKFSLKQKWRKSFPRAAIITAAEFEAMWRRAEPTETGADPTANA